MDCPDCEHKFDDKEILSEAGKINGQKKSEAKAIASRENGKKGGRPRKQNATNETRGNWH